MSIRTYISNTTMWCIIHFFEDIFNGTELPKIIKFIKRIFIIFLAIYLIFIIV